MKHETKLDYIISYYNEYVEENKGQSIYFVTIQPQSICWTEAEAYQYLNNLLPNSSYVMQLEQNFEQKYKQANLIQGLHIHLLIAECYLSHLTNVTYYQSPQHLNQIKKQAKGSVLTITATKIYSEYVFRYLSKQENGFTPMFCKKKYSNSNTKMDKTENSKMISVFYLFQLLHMGTTASKISITREKRRKKEKKAERSQSLYFTSLAKEVFKANLKRADWIAEVYVPFLPNAPAKLKKTAIYR